MEAKGQFKQWRRVHEAMVHGEGWTLRSRLCRCPKKKWSEMTAELPRLQQLSLREHPAVWEFTSFSVEGRQGRWCPVDQCVFSTAVFMLSQTLTSLGWLSFLTQTFYWHVYVLLLSGRYFLVVFPVCVPSSSSLVSRLFCFVFGFIFSKTGLSVWSQETSPQADDYKPPASVSLVLGL